VRGDFSGSNSLSSSIPIGFHSPHTWLLPYDLLYKFSRFHSLSHHTHHLPSPQHYCPPPEPTTIMQSTTPPTPYITAVLTSEHSILDLSGKQPLTLSITLTLHASAPILCYTEPCDTFFLPRNALTDVGIIFTDCKTKEEIRICHIDSVRRPGYARNLTEKTRLLLRPETPVVFDVGSNIHSDKDTETGFDPWMADLGSVFESEGIYEATLPLYRTLDWWRYAKPSKHEATASSSMDTSNNFISILREKV
jgi:hypothetical protein